MKVLSFEDEQLLRKIDRLLLEKGIDVGVIAKDLVVKGALRLVITLL